MKFFNFGKKNSIYLMVERYLLQINESIQLFNRTVSVFSRQGISEEFLELINKTHLAESMADDIRREIELAFYEKSLIPESRGDILELLELTDRVFNKAQSVLYQIETQNMKIPAEFKEGFLQLIDTNISAYCGAIEGFKALFTDIKKVRDRVREVDVKESSSDRQERDLIRKIFAAGCGTGEKILLKELVIEIGHISDLSEEVTDFLNIMAVKRMI